MALGNRLPVNEGQVTAVGAIAIGAALLAALVGAILGSLAGMRFHRKVDAVFADNSAGHLYNVNPPNTKDET